MLLALLEREPKHGYQLIAELDVLFGDAYEPSTGTVYPAIRALEDEKLVRSKTEGRRAVYSLSDIGQRALDDRADMLAALELRTGVHVRGGGAIDRVLQRARAAAGLVDLDKALAVLEQAAEDLESMAGGKR